MSIYVLIQVFINLRLVPSNTTLVVAPASVIYQWEAEVKLRVKSNKLLVHVFHGPKNKREDDPRRFSLFLLLFTYGFEAGSL